MADFSFVQNDQNGKWVILAPRRSHRTNTKGTARLCPFCIGSEDVAGVESYRFPAEDKHILSVDWQIRVIENKFPFTPHHEVVIHSPDHHKNFDELPFSQVALIFQTYKQRYLTLSQYGQVYIFHNRGLAAGESIPHPHSQIAVLPFSMQLNIPSLESDANFLSSLKFWTTSKQPMMKQELLETDYFTISCPATSEWPDEVWIAPKRVDTNFGEINDHEITDLSFVFARVLQLLDLRHGYEFPFNFYIYPGKSWYLRLLPRVKIVGGFEVGTQIMVNTQAPQKTFAFLQEHFWEPNHEKIKLEQQADYWKGV